MLADLGKTRVWREAYAEGFALGFAIGIEIGKTQHKVRIIRRCLERGMSTRKIAELLDISVPEIKCLGKKKEK